MWHVAEKRLRRRPGNNSGRASSQAEGCELRARSVSQRHGRLVAGPCARRPRAPRNIHTGLTATTLWVTTTRGAMEREAWQLWQHILDIIRTGASCSTCNSKTLQIFDTRWTLSRCHSLLINPYYICYPVQYWHCDLHFFPPFAWGYHLQDSLAHCSIMTAEPSPTPDEKHARIIEPKPSTGSAGQSEALTDGQELTVKAGAAYIRIFTYAEPRHVFLGALAFVAALGSGAGLALVNLVLGEFVGILNDYVAGEITKQQFMKNVTTYCLYFLYIGIARLVLTYAYTTLSNYCAYHIVRNIRRRYLKSALSQEVAFYDRGTAGSISMQATSNGNLIQSGIAEKLALTFQSASTFVTAFIIAFVSQWKLTLILLCVAPTLIILMGIVASIEAKIETQMLDVYGKAGAYAESVLSTTRTVQAFGLRERLVARYATFVAHARSLGDKKSPLYGALFSIEYFVIYGSDCPCNTLREPLLMGTQRGWASPSGKASKCSLSEKSTL